MSDVQSALQTSRLAAEGSGFFGRDWMEFATRPNPTYSNRARRLAELREQVARSHEYKDEDRAVPTSEAVEAAKTFINGLVAGMLSRACRIAISHDGEINFFFDGGAGLFQILIDRDGLLSYHGQRRNEEMLDSQIRATDFPHLRLLTFFGG
jgi:hypothetical protein